MADTYAILGVSHNTETPTVLYTSGSYSEADRWRDGYSRWGDWGGYESLELYEVGPDQNPDTIHLHDAPIDSVERDDLSVCDLCERVTALDDISHTECGHAFCPECGDSGQIRWLHCDRQGEQWAYLA
tara:strand:+ start:64 stop:447 length:384 start_codon:yes stop_codon:yes gene_type:complete